MNSENSGFETYLLLRYLFEVLMCAIFYNFDVGVINNPTVNEGSAI